MMISVTVKIHHGFKKLLPAGMKTGDPLDISVEDDTAVGDLIRDKIKLPADIPKMILINGLHSKDQQTLKNGDKVSLFMPMAGG
jgi:molybdopterin converting factor small subunit